MLTPVKYQSLGWQTSQSRRHCTCGDPPYMDYTSSLIQLIGTTPYNSYNLMDYTYNGDLMTPSATTRTPTLVRFAADSPYDYCYSRTTGNPYWGSIQVHFDKRSANVGDIALNDYLRLNFNYTSNVTFYAYVQLLKANGQLISAYTVELPAHFQEGSFEDYIFVSINNNDGYEIKITFYSSTVDDDAMFCFSDLSVMNMTTINTSSLRLIDCNGAETTLSFTTEYFGDQILITATWPQVTQGGYLRIQGGINPAEQDAFDAASKLYSNNFNLFTPTSSCSNLIQILWRSQCHLENQATSYTSIEYEFYLKGFVQRVPMVTDERVTHTYPTGRKATIYNSDFLPYEIVTGRYNIWVQETMERAYVDEYFSVNGDEYQVDNTSTYAIAPLSGDFSGRVEMIKVGTERILSDCCCPIAEVTIGCGTLRIMDVCIVATQRLIKYEIVDPGTGSSVDVMFENLEAIDTGTCTEASGKQHIESSVSTIGAAANAAYFTAGDFQNVFDNEYCGVTDIQYYLRIRMRCNDAIQGDWSDPVTIVPDNLEVCS